MMTQQVTMKLQGIIKLYLQERERSVKQKMCWYRIQQTHVPIKIIHKYRAKHKTRGITNLNERVKITFYRLGRCGTYIPKKHRIKKNKLGKIK